jgi:hypothetical protein
VKGVQEKPAGGGFPGPVSIRRPGRLVRRAPGRRLDRAVELLACLVVDGRSWSVLVVFAALAAP